MPGPDGFSDATLEAFASSRGWHTSVEPATRTPHRTRYRATVMGRYATTGKSTIAVQGCTGSASSADEAVAIALASMLRRAER